MESAEDKIFTVNWYPSKNPEEIDIVIINFDNLEDTWIFVKLLEYKSLGAQKNIFL